MNATLGIGMTSARTRARMIERLRTQGIRDEFVLAAMTAVPRHLFLDEAIAHRAYDDTPLPIGHGQTISQPYVVARMIELLRAGRTLRRVLEIGTGCGYQTAVLSHLAEEVYTVERVSALLALARRNLQTLKVSNVRSKHADGSSLSTPELAFDGIVVSAAATHIAPTFLQHLNEGGRLVIPLSQTKTNEGDQYLVVCQKTAQGVQETRYDEVRFVPLLSGVM